MRPDEADRLELSSASPGSGQQARWRMPYAPRPKYIQLETVTKCNAKCPFCPQNEIVRDPAKMPADTWQKIVDDTRGWGITYRPFLTNEPFVDKRQAEIVRYIKANDPTATVEYNTNGELMTEDLGRDLLEAGVDILRFSVDGFSPETYEPSRVGIAYNRVLERVTAFLDLWDREGYRDKVFTEMRMIEVAENKHEIEAYKAYWEPKCSRCSSPRCTSGPGPDKSARMWCSSPA